MQPGRADSEAFGRCVSAAAQRQAITLPVLGSVAAVPGSIVILRVSDLPSDLSAMRQRGVARSLTDLGYDVMGMDRDAAPVQRWADRLTHAVQADATDLLIVSGPTRQVEKFAGRSRSAVTAPRSGR